MAFFRRKDANASVIPPVAAPPAAEPRPRANGGGGGDLYVPRPGAAPSYRSTPGDPYGDARGQADRDALLGGYQPKEGGQQVQQRKYGYEGRENEEDFDEGEEVEGIKTEMRQLKGESLAGTQNALRLAREAEATAEGSIARLGQQSDMIAKTERHLDIAKANNQRAEDKADELRKLNRSIFKPVVVWNKEGKRQAQEDKINARHLREMDEREKARKDVIETRQRLTTATDTRTFGSSDLPLPGQQALRKAQRERFQFEATASDDEIEDEIDDNLNETLKVTQRLKKLAMAAGEEIDTHNKRLVGITDKTTDLDFALLKNTERLRRAGGKS